MPTEFSSAYSVPFVVPTPGGTVRAMASAAGYSDSAAVTATYSVPMIAALDLIQTADGRLFSAINAAGGGQIEQSAQTQQSVIGYQVLFVPSPTTAGDLKGRV
jgi:hypothetical protein